MTVSEKPLSLEAFLQRPERKPALEYEDGAVRRKVSPKGKHSLLRFALCDRINQFAAGRKLALALPELRATFAGRSYVPDVSVYRWQRLPHNAAGQIADDFHQAPDIAIEIVSPRQSVTALLRRCLWYVANRVQIALLVDAADRSILLVRPDSTARALRGGDAIDLRPLLPGFDATVEQLFARLDLASPS